MRRLAGKLRVHISFGLLLLLLLLGVALNMNIGSVRISPTEVFRVIFWDRGSTMLETNIIWRLRLPRLIAAAVLGGGLSVSGFLLQTFFRNPIAGPYVLGISSGAKLFVGVVMITLLPYWKEVPVSIVILAAFAGSMASMGFVLIFARRVRSMAMLLVMGIMIGYICSALTDFFITFAQETDIANLHTWSLGSFSGMSWQSVQTATAVTLAGLCAAVLLSKPIGAYQLGEGYAQSIGINIKTFRILLILLSSLLSAVVTAFAGPISFVGIAVPHITKKMVNTSNPLIVIPMCFLCGGAFCLFCDLIARTAFSPTEMSIGTVTSILGAPIVISIVMSRRRSA